MGLSEDLAALKEAQPHFVFLDYEGLKAAAESKDADAVLRRLRGELDKVNDVVTVQWEVLSTEFTKQLSKDDVDNPETLENLAKAIVQLHSYVSLSYDALMGIVRICGEQEETASCAWFASRVDGAPFRAYDFDALLAPLGRLYENWRGQHGQPGAPWLDAQGDSHGLAQVFWIPKGSAMLAKVELLKLLAPAARQVRIPTTSTSRSAARRVVDVVRSKGNYNYDWRHKLSLVFFDSPQGDQYAERYRRNLPAAESTSERPRTKLLQCSWVHDSDRDTEVHLSVEDVQGVATEAHLPHREMPALLAGKLDAAEVAAKGGTSSEECKQQQIALESALSIIRDGGLRPSVSASFQRSSYVMDSAGGPSEIACVDEELIFTDEAAAVSGGWCLAAGMKRAEEEFQGAVLQVRLPAAGTEKLLACLGSLDLKPMPGFSVALHATALFHRQLAVPPPPWIPSENLPAAAGSSFQAPDAEQPGSSTKEAAGVASPGRSTKSAKAPVKETANKPAAAAGAARRVWRCFPPNKKPDTKLFVDVKTPMASERTVIRWFRSAVLLASLSGLLMASADVSANVNGFLLGLAALMFIGMPTRQFWQRSMEFTHPESAQPKVDRTLPKVLSMILSVILTATLIVEAFGPQLGTTI